MLTKNYLAIYAKSFNWAGFFLPKKTYDKCSALYDFCRVVDNIADEENEVEIKKNNFSKFKNNFINQNYDDPVIKNMWDIINEYNISIKIIEDNMVRIIDAGDKKFADKSIEKFELSSP